MTVAEIHFNYDPGSASTDAINLRDGEPNKPSFPVKAPEYESGPIEKPVAYTQAELEQTGSIVILARFTDGPPDTTVDIRATAHAGTVLGDVDARPVQFDVNGDSELLAFKLPARLNLATVGKRRHEWRWEFEASPGAWALFETTQHDIFLIPALPNAPWTQGVEEPLDRQFPWVAALELACLWAAGTTTVDEAAEAVARQINEHPNHKYDESGTQFIDKDTDEFLLTDYLAKLGGATSFNLDCVGAATAMVTFANLLGADLRPLRLRNTAGPDGRRGRFSTNPVMGLNDGSWGIEGWSYHEVAVIESSLVDNGQTLEMVTGEELPDGPGENVLIYDAALALDEPPPFVPIRNALGTINEDGYRSLLVPLVSVNPAEFDNERFNSARPRDHRQVV